MACIWPTDQGGRPALFFILFLSVLCGTAWSQDRPAGPAKKGIPSMSVEQAIEALKSPRALQQERGAVALVEWGEKASPAVGTIVAILEDEWPIVRTDLLFVLIELGPAANEAVPILIKVAGNSSFHARYLACRALGNIGKEAKPAVPTLLKALRDQVTSVRRRAAEALGRLGGDVAPEAVQPLIRAAGDPIHQVREAAIIALGNFGELAKPAIGMLKQTAFNETSAERVRAAESLWKLTHDTQLVLPLLTKLLRESDLEWEAAQVMVTMGAAAKQAVPNLIDALKQDESIQIHAAEALGAIGPGAKPALPALRALLNHKEEDVRSAARDAIQRIEGKLDATRQLR